MSVAIWEQEVELGTSRFLILWCSGNQGRGKKKTRGRPNKTSSGILLLLSQKVIKLKQFLERPVNVIFIGRNIF